MAVAWSDYTGDLWHALLKTLEYTFVSFAGAVLVGLGIALLRLGPTRWMRVPEGMTSWSFFDALLDRANVVGTPGAGFGPAGEGFLRLSAFNSHENVEEALDRIRKAFGR